MFWVVLLLTVAFTIAAFLFFRAYAVRRKKLCLVAGIVSASCSLVGIVYSAATLLLVASVP